MSPTDTQLPGAGAKPRDACIMDPPVEPQGMVHKARPRARGDAGTGKAAVTADAAGESGPASYA